MSSNCAHRSYGYLDKFYSSITRWFFIVTSIHSSPLYCSNASSVVYALHVQYFEVPFRLFVLWFIIVGAYDSIMLHFWSYGQKGRKLDSSE